MPKEDLTFSKLAIPAPRAGSPAVWTAPQARLDLGGHIAVWAEQGSQQRFELNADRQLPWLALHGGPGGSLSAAHVAPLRFAGVPWFGFDQRNSGLSEDLDLSILDLQRFVDDALEIADRLDIPRFHILGGSWGATLALAIATYRPERVASVILRAPFIPMRARVDAFFESLERISPDYFSEHFGPGARTDFICECFEVATPEHLLELSVAWNQLENALLRNDSSFNPNKSPLSDQQQFLLVRKYRLQAHFLKYDCFLPPLDWNRLVSGAAQSDWPLSIVQGLNDRICPPGGARMISEMILRTKLIELQDTGHLADSGNMMAAISREITRHLQQH